MKSDIKDIKLAPLGSQLINWAYLQMPVLDLIRRRFKKEQTLKGVTLAACLTCDIRNSELNDHFKRGRSQSIFMRLQSPINQ